MASILGQQGAMVFWAVVALACLVSVVLRLTAVRARGGTNGSWLQDKAWEGMSQVSAQTSPRWMQGRFGTVVYVLFGTVFLVIALGAVAVRLVQGPAPTAQTVNSTDQTNSTGAF